MSDHFSPNGSFINSIVGEGTSFRGELRVSGLLRIDGDFSGRIETAGKVLVGKNGRAECTVKAETVVIGGVLKGNVISSEKVVILSTGMLIGNVSTPRLIVEEGVILDGKCRISIEPAADVRAGSPVNSQHKTSADNPATDPQPLSRPAASRLETYHANKDSYTGNAPFANGSDGKSYAPRQESVPVTTVREVRDETSV